MNAKIPSALTVADLNTALTPEPRILDLRLAERLGYDRARDVRQLIERNADELESYGPLAVRRRKSRGQDFAEYHLNEPQALLLCMMSRTKAAAAIRREVIEVYLAYRHGQGAMPPRPLGLREKRLLVAECRKVNGIVAAQAMWRDLGLPGLPPGPLAVSDLSRPDVKPGTALVVMAGQIVVVDLTDTDLRDGDRALVVQDYHLRRGPMVSAIRRLAGDRPDLDGGAHLPSLPPAITSLHAAATRTGCRVLGRVIDTRRVPR